MMFPHMALLAQATDAASQATGRTVYELARLKVFDDPRLLVGGLVVVAACLGAFVWFMYRRDTTEQSRLTRWVLIALRTTALAGILFFFLHLEKRAEREIVHNSRVLILVDSSQSMGLHDSDSTGVPATPSRMDVVVEQLTRGPMLDELRRVHDVVLARFDSETVRLASLVKRPVESTAGGVEVSRVGREQIAWQEILVPQGTETRLGEALRTALNEQRGSPLAAVVVVTDGAQNAGIEPAAGIELAKEAEVPIYTIGIGSAQRPESVRVGDFLAPARAYPGDAFTVTGYIQSQGLANRTVTVELYSQPAGDEQAVPALEGSQRVTLAGDGEAVPVKYEITPDAPGRRTYELRISAPAEDRNAADNTQQIDVEVVDRQTRVLLIAGGPTREYRFLRNQLRRDKDIIVDVWLQTAQEGVSQDANAILDDFCTTREELFQYDAIVAFDPDWELLAPDQVDLLEQWVAEQAGGLITVAGPIHTTSWSRNTQMAKILDLYPVEFQRRLSLLDDAEYGATTAWPLKFTREGMDAEFLWIEDSAVASAQAWQDFPGVYGHYGVKGAKPGASVYARFSDPEAIQSGELPVYFAGQFYGAGRVFYLGSGEMWRLRSESESYFERFYTKLIRHVSQGRLLRGSSRGILMVQHDRYLLGDTVDVRAQLSDEQHEPFDAPSIALQVTRPDSTTQTVVLAADTARKGNFRGQFTVLQEGAFRLDLPVPETVDEQLTRRVQVRVPDLERENPQRDDALLSEIASATGGIYYVGFDAALGRGGSKPLVGQLPDRTEITRLLGAPDQEFERRLMYILLAVVCGALCLEWLIRRLSRLA